MNEKFDISIFYFIKIKDKCEIVYSLNAPLLPTT